MSEFRRIRWQNRYIVQFYSFVVFAVCCVSFIRIVNDESGTHLSRTLLGWIESDGLGLRDSAYLREFLEEFEELHRQQPA